MRGFGLAALAILLLWSGPAAAWTQPPEDGVAQSLPLAPVTVETRKGDVALRAQIADTDARRQTGLMFRRSMPETEGMLFVFPSVREVSFWMKNTYISLDILFIDGDGTIVNIVRDTVPFSLAPIPSGRPARGVLEINAGASTRLGIEVGDTVRHTAFE